MYYAIFPAHLGQYRFLPLPYQDCLTGTGFRLTKRENNHCCFASLFHAPSLHRAEYTIINMPSLSCVCGQTAHSRRSSRLCPLNSRFAQAFAQQPSTSTATASASVIPTITTPVVCKLCGLEGHVRRSHANCLMNTRTLTTTTAEPVCNFCGESGHSRTSHRNCQLNTKNTYLLARRAPFAESLVPRNDTLNRRHNIGSMSSICQYCRAKLWILEKPAGTLNHPKFTLCCANGKVSLPATEPQPVIYRLLTDNSAEAADFRKKLECTISLSHLHHVLQITVMN